MIRRLRPVLLVAVALWLPVAAGAQTASELLDQGIRAYRNLDFDAAAGFLRRSLVAPAAQALPDSARARALTYLGATEVFRGRRDTATAVFRRLLLLDPRARPDQLIFPPEVSNAYEAVRRVTKAVTIAVPADTEIQLGDELYPVRLYATSFHDIAVAVTREDGSVLRALYTGPISDSLVVRWDGLDSAGTAPAIGRFRVQVSSRDPQGRTLRRVQEPLETRTRIPDTLAHPSPPDSGRLPERGSSGPALRALGAGLGAGILVATLPSVIANGTEASGTRFVVAGAVSLTGIYGFLAQRPGRRIPANIAVNRAARETWERRRDQVAQENATRRRNVRLRVLAGTVIDSEQDNP